MHCTCNIFLFQQNPWCTCRSEAAHGRLENKTTWERLLKEQLPAPASHGLPNPPPTFCRNKTLLIHIVTEAAPLLLTGFLWAQPITLGNQVLMVGRGEGGPFPIHLFSFNENRFHPILNLFKWAGRIQSYTSKLHSYCDHWSRKNPQ